MFCPGTEAGRQEVGKKELGTEAQEHTARLH